MKPIYPCLFTWRKVLLLTAIFAGIIILMQRALRYICENCIDFDCPYYWPISVFNLRLPSPLNLVMAGVVALIFLISVRYLEARKFNLTLVIVFSVILITGSTLIQGLMVGFYAPIAGDAQSGVLIPYTSDGQEYYHDALRVSDPVDFFRRYNEIQPTLNQHGHTHPPGAVLTLYFLEKVLGDPALIALVIMLVSAVPTAFFFHRMMRTEITGEMAGYMTFLLMLLPAIQVYYLATLDALVTALLTATLYFFCYSVGRKGSIAAVITLSLSFLLTFVSLFILPVLVGFDLIVRRSLKRSFVVIGGVMLIQVLLYVFTGYNSLRAFRTSSLYENPQGYMMFVEPANYLFTRLEDVAEIILFLGPFSLVLLLRGLKNFRQPLMGLTALGCTTLIAMYLTGAWRTGETARACAFIFPYLLFPIGRYLEQEKAGESARLQLAVLVFGQTIAMQTFGNYQW